MKKIVILFISFLFISCFGLFDNRTREISNGYKLIWIDLPQQNRFIENKNNEVVINSHVYSAGFDENYILAKQHPKINTNQVDKKKTNYFVIQLKKEATIGPIDSISFYNFIKLNKLEHISFSLTD
ncbi:hypothetical protein [Flavobacterium sp.]|uniref:hypothetical protein n=1 Tax=Flavobacterium sp. TaxID=239 RepID=UPI003751BA14